MNTEKLLKLLQAPMWTVPMPENFTDEELIAELRRRGYAISRLTPASHDQPTADGQQHREYAQAASGSDDALRTTAGV